LGHRAGPSVVVRVAIGAMERFVAMEKSLARNIRGFEVAKMFLIGAIGVFVDDEGCRGCHASRRGENEVANDGSVDLQARWGPDWWTEG